MQKTAEEWLDLALTAKDLQTKLEYCAKYLELEPNDKHVWEYKGKILADLGQSRESILCLKNAYKGTGAAYAIARIMIGEDNECVIEILSDEVVKKEPRALISKGKAFLHLKRPEEAIACFDKVLEAKISKLCDIQALFWKGFTLVDLGKYEEAINCYDKVLDIDPGAYRAWFEKSYVLLYKLEGRDNEAVECFSEALKITPKVADFKDEFLQRAQEKSRATEKKGFFKKFFG